MPQKSNEGKMCFVSWLFIVYMIWLSLTYTLFASRTTNLTCSLIISISCFDLLEIVKDFNKRFGSLVINGPKKPEIYFSILYVYLKSRTREADWESFSNVSNPYLSLYPWVFFQIWWMRWVKKKGLGFSKGGSTPWISDGPDLPWVLFGSEVWSHCNFSLETKQVSLGIWSSNETQHLWTLNFSILI